MVIHLKGMLCGVPTPIVPLIKMVCAVSPPSLIVKLQSELANPTEVGVDFVFHLSQPTITSNSHQNLPEGSVLQAWNLALRGAIKKTLYI